MAIRPIYVVTDGDTLYTSAIAANGGTEVETIDQIRAGGNSSIRSVSLKSKQERDWEVQLVDVNGNVLSSKQWKASDGKKQLDADGESFVYYDCGEDLRWKIPRDYPEYRTRIQLKNNSSRAKTSGANGKISLIINACITT